MFSINWPYFVIFTLCWGKFDLPHRTFMEKSHEVAQQLVEATEIQRVYGLHSVP